MSALFKASILILTFSCWCASQEPVPILSAKWSRTIMQAPDPDVTSVGPVTPVTTETKYFQRKAREARTDHPIDPDKESIEGRSRAMDQAVRESRTPKADDQQGYTYVAGVRNDTGKTVDVIYWEYRFKEIARPSNVVRRQFLCSAKLKNGDKRELSAFTILGPSDVIDAESLAQKTGKIFEEAVLVNRIEFADGTILQRHGWKLQDVKAGVERATSTPWGREVCRGI